MNHTALKMVECMVETKAKHSAGKPTKYAISKRLYKELGDDMKDLYGSIGVEVPFDPHLKSQGVDNLLVKGVAVYEGRL